MKGKKSLYSHVTHDQDVHDALFLSLKGLEYYTHDATTFAIYCYGSFIFFKTRKLRSLYVVSAYKIPASTLSKNSSFVLDRRKWVIRFRNDWKSIMTQLSFNWYDVSDLEGHKSQDDCI